MNETLLFSENSTQDCCAVLLRGGRSRRMGGRDKALLPWKKSTFLETIASQMDFLEEKYLSVAAADDSKTGDPNGQNSRTVQSVLTGQNNPDGHINCAIQPDSNMQASPGILSDDWIRLPDLIPDCGPLGGIYTALATCKAQWALVVSCDVPAVEESFFKMLLAQRSQEADIIYPLTPDGRMHMTCAVYRKSIAPLLLQQLEKGNNRLRVLPEFCRAKAIRIEQPDLVRMLSNINTNEELNRILYYYKADIKSDNILKD